MKVNITGKIGAALVIIGSAINTLFGILLIVLGIQLFQGVQGGDSMDGGASEELFGVMMLIIFSIVLLIMGLFLIVMSMLFIGGSIYFMVTGKFKILLGITTAIVLMGSIMGLVGGILILASKTE